MSKKGGAKKESGEGPQFSIGDIVLGRIKGYPPWPAKIVDPEVEYLTPVVKKGGAGKEKKLLVKYYTDANYSWSLPKELKPLSAKAIDEFLENKGAKNSSLATAYATAKNPEQWEAEQSTIQENLKAGIVDDDEATASGSKKRKNKASDSGTSKKAKAEPKKKNDKAGKPEKEGTLVRLLNFGGIGVMVNLPRHYADEDSSPGAKQCREWRVKLQKTFLTEDKSGGEKKTKVAAEKDMPEMDEIYTKMESFEHKAEWLQPSKLPKVVKRIALLKEDIPKEDEYKFKARSAALVDKWKTIIYPDGAPANEDADDVPGTATTEKMDVDEPKEEASKDEAAAAEPATNGDAETKADEAAETNGDAKAEEAAPIETDEKAAPAVEAEKAD